MRLDAAADRFLTHRAVERDSTPSSLTSYAWLLGKLLDEFPDAHLSDFEGKQGTEKLRGFLRQYAHLAASTRKNRISILHSFFGWLESEDLIDHDPSRKIKTPPTRKPSVYRPTPAELALIRSAASMEELPAILLLEGVGLRNREVRETLWRHVNLTDGTIQVRRKGGAWRTLPLAQDVLDALRRCYRELEPEPDDHVFVCEVLRFDRPGHLARVRKDPKAEASSQALARLVHRVSKRAIGKQLYPHQLRHGFAKRFLSETPSDIRALQGLLSHTSVQTTETYLDEVHVDEMRAGLERAHKGRPGGQREQRPDRSSRKPASAPGGIRTPGSHPSTDPLSGLEREPSEGSETDPEGVSHERDD